MLSFRKRPCHIRNYGHLIAVLCNRIRSWQSCVSAATRIVIAKHQLTWMLSIDLISRSWHVEVFGSAPESVIEVEVPHLPIQLVGTHVTFDEVIPCPLDGTQRVLCLSCKQWGSERNVLNKTHKGRRGYTSQPVQCGYCSPSEDSVRRNGKSRRDKADTLIYIGCSWLEKLNYHRLKNNNLLFL
jgi:hypothetical protein